MERVTAIINSLKDKHESGCSKEELLLLIEQLKSELNTQVQAVNHHTPTVSVMMPAGYQPIPTNIYEAIVNGREIPPAPINATLPDTNLEQVTLKVKDQESEKGSSELQNLEKQRTFYSVPRPPKVTMVEIEEEPVKVANIDIFEEIVPEIEVHTLNSEATMHDSEVVPEVEVVFPEVDTKIPKTEMLIPNVGEMKKKESSVLEDILGFLNFSRPEKKELPLDLKEPVDEPNMKNEKVVRPLLYDLEINKKEENSNSFFHNIPTTQEEQLYLDEVETLVMPQERSKLKELHEILASRIVANPIGQTEGHRMLSEKLGSGKITDLRKGIAVNDRFRFIKSLFRSDEMLFDRSIKTINNFSILAEAQYWIQRELVIKLGWNDEDELVQQFYSLVSRRFL